MSDGALLRREGWAVVVLFAALLVLLAGECSAAAVGVVNQSTKTINLEVGKSVIVRAPKPVTRISLGTDEIADYVLLSPNQVYLTGKVPGVTNMTLWANDDQIAGVYDVLVSMDISRLRTTLHKILPEERDIQVHATHDSLTLSGTVSNAGSLSQVLALADAYNTTKDRKVINLLQVTGVQQVMLEVRVAEMSRSMSRRLGVNFFVGNDGSIGGSTIGNIVSIDEFIGTGENGSVQLNLSQTLNTFFHIAGGNFTWTQFMDVLKQEGYVKILAEPTLITLSGQPASFLAGGEFPVPVPQGLGTVAIEYKDFGVGLSFTPTILNDRRINIKVEPEVSELDFSTAINVSGVAVPGLTVRRVSTVVELGDGQSFAIAGLLRDSVRDTVSKFPLLGDLPILGPLFRSTSFQRNETELIVIVTPRLVKPLDVAKQRLPGEDYIEPDDCEFYWMGLIQGRKPVGPASPVPLNGPGGMEGRFGHSIPKY